MKRILTLLTLVAPLTLNAQSDMKNKAMTLKIGSYEKEYEIRKPTPDADVEIFYVSDFVDNVDLIEASAEQLANRIVEAGLNTNLGAIVVPGDKANSIGAILTQKLRKSNPSLALAVLRSSKKGGVLHSVSYQSITNPEPKQMHLRPDQLSNLKGQRVIIVDDVISTGATARAAKELVEKAGAKVVGFACVATESSEDPGNHSTFEGLPLIRVTHFPVIPLKEQ